MDELAVIWSRLIETTLQNAKVQGRADIVDYLKLKIANDQLRTVSANWLFDSFREFAGDANRKGLGIVTENIEPHRFEFRNARMTGGLLRFRDGVRELSVEAGWPRTPTDGFIRGGGIAVARIAHFGLSKHNAEFSLIRAESDEPRWVLASHQKSPILVSVNYLAQHFRLFLDED
jgi:hypothetical protein